MKKSDFIELVVENLKSGSTIHFYQFMFRNIFILEEMTYSDWLSILQRIKNSPLSLYTFLPFMYKFLGVDLIDKFLSFDGVSLATIGYVKESLGEKYNFLCLSSMDVSMLRSHDGLIGKLVALKLKLQGEGATSVKKLLYTGNEPPSLIDFEELL